MSDLISECFTLLREDGVVRISDSKVYFQSGSTTLNTVLNDWKEKVDVSATPNLAQYFLKNGKNMSKLKMELSKKLAEYNKEHAKPVEDDIDFKEATETLEGTSICYDMSNINSGYFVYDFDNLQELTHIDAEAYLKSLERERMRNDPPVPVMNVYGEYNPFRYGEAIYKKEVLGKEYDVINRFSPPSWMLEEKNPSAELHPLLAKFFESVFPDQEQRKMVFAWIRNMVVSRNQTILCLNGARATGKTILGERILPPLVGVSNYRKSGEGFLKKEFNSIMSRTRFVYVDEFPLRDAAMTKIKNYLNDNISIEGKGQDERMETNFCSIMYSSNNITDLAIKWDERRFSVIDVRTTSLLESMSGEEISELVNLCDNDEKFITDFANWILHNGKHPKYSDINFCHKGDHFHRLVRANLTNWQRSLIEGVSKDYLEIEEYTMRDIKKLFKGIRNKYVPDNMAKLSDFFSNFKDKNGERPGHIRASSVDQTEAVFVPNKKFFESWIEDVKRDYEYLSQDMELKANDAQEKEKLDGIINEVCDDEIF